MVLAFIIAAVVAIFFIILWSEERDKREQAEFRIKQLTRENKKLAASKSPLSVKETNKSKKPVSVHSDIGRLEDRTVISDDLFAEIIINEGAPTKGSIRQNNTSIVQKNTLTREHPRRIQVSEVITPITDQGKEPPFLDQIKLDALKVQTREAQDLLAEIFIQEDDSSKDNVQVNNDGTIIEILEKLFTKEQWSRGELAEIVGPNVMLGNLLEQINDYAYSNVNDIVVEEDGDTIYVMTEYKDQLI